jgi:hypothetical protein
VGYDALISVKKFGHQAQLMWSVESALHFTPYTSHNRNRIETHESGKVRRYYFDFLVLTGFCRNLQMSWGLGNHYFTFLDLFGIDYGLTALKQHSNDDKMNKRMSKEMRNFGCLLQVHFDHFEQAYHISWTVCQSSTR